MDFDEWHYKQLNGDADNCPHEKWERTAWDSACEFAAMLAEETADGTAAEAIAEAILGMRSAQAIARSNVVAERQPEREARRVPASTAGRLSARATG